MENYSSFRNAIEKMEDEDCSSSLEEDKSSWEDSYSDDGYDEDAYQEGELCVCCDDEPANPYYQLEDGFYCGDCYESQRDWD